MGTSLRAFVSIRCPACGEEYDVARDSPEFGRDPFVCTLCVPLEAATYTVVLTQGTLGLDQTEADRVTEAIVSRAPYVDVTCDSFGDGTSKRPMRIVFSGEA